MRDTLVRIRSALTSTINTDQGQFGVLQLTTPTGDYRRFVLTPEQADHLASAFVSMSCDLAT